MGGAAATAPGTHHLHRQPPRQASVPSGQAMSQSLEFFVFVLSAPTVVTCQPPRATTAGPPRSHRWRRARSPMNRPRVVAIGERVCTTSSPTRNGSEHSAAKLWRVSPQRRPTQACTGSRPGTIARLSKARAATFPPRIGSGPLPLRSRLRWLRARSLKPTCLYNAPPTPGAAGPPSAGARARPSSPPSTRRLWPAPNRAGRPALPTVSPAPHQRS